MCNAQSHSICRKCTVVAFNLPSYKEPINVSRDHALLSINLSRKWRCYRSQPILSNMLIILLALHSNSDYGECLSYIGTEGIRPLPYPVSSAWSMRSRILHRMP